MPFLLNRHDLYNEHSRSRTNNNLILIHHQFIPITKLDLFLFSLGLILNCFSYYSLTPALMVIIFYFFGYFLLNIPFISGYPEKQLFTRVYIILFLVSGVAAIYANQFNDVNQTLKDAGNFFYFSTVDISSLSLPEIYLITDGSLMVKIWGFIYNSFEYFGFSKEPYIGILFNILLNCFSGVVGIKIIRLLFGFDLYRFKKFTLFYSCTGIIWLISSTHLRDSLSFFLCNILLLSWVHCLTFFRFDFRLFFLLAVNLSALYLFPYIREEFLSVPLGFTFCAFASVLLSINSKSSDRSLRLIFLVFGLILSIVVFFVYFSSIIYTFNYVQGTYLGVALDSSSDNSLGMSLIVSQPLFIRIFLGSIYLILSPIPFWSGFQFELIMPLFKSFNALLFYFLLPLFFTSLLQIISSKSLRNSVLLFLVSTSICFTFAIAGTSLELRHLGNFILPILLVCTVPDLRIRHIRTVYNRILFVILSLILIIHLLWIVLKFIS